jgi:Kazal-type serine protease inhibitor-like protein
MPAPLLKASFLSVTALCLFACLGCAETKSGRAATPCATDMDCPVESLCSPTGVCDVAICTQDYTPVCATDGKTYGNACQARAHHVVPAYNGECGKPSSPPAGQDCGGIQGLICPEGMACELAEGICRGRDLMGKCVPQAEECPSSSTPVCGCDGITYLSDCVRIKAEVQKDHPGPCLKS